MLTKVCYFEMIQKIDKYLVGLRKKEEKTKNEEL